MKTKKITKNQAEKILKLGIKYHSQGNIYEAEKYYKQFLQSGYTNPNVLSNYGVICKQSDRKQKAIDLYKRSIKLYPNNPEACSNLGSLLLELNKTNEAIVYLKKAVDLKHDFANAHYNLGAGLKDLGLFEEAEISTRQAIKINPKEAKAHSNLGAILKNLGKFKEAKVSIKEALRLDRDLVRAYFVLSLLLKNEESFDQKDYLFSSAMLEKKRKEEMIDIYFARSNVMHKNKEYTESAKHLKAANDIKLSIYPSDLNYICKKTKQILVETNKYQIEKRITTYNQTSIFIVGLPRSGSTLIESIISMSPLVKDLGEVNYFEESYLEWKKNKNSNLSEIYSSKLPKFTDKQIISTNKWLYNFQYAGLISKSIPHAKIIHCIRHPLDNILSIYRAHFAQGSRYSSSIIDTAKIYLEEKKIMNTYIKQFPNEIFKINYEALVSDSESTIKKLISWLGWEWDEMYLSPHLNIRAISTASSVQARSPINTKSISSWKKYEKLLEPAIEIINLKEK